MRVVLAILGCVAMTGLATAQTTAPATRPATAPATSTTSAPASQPSRYVLKVNGQNVSVGLPEANLRLDFTMPEFWVMREGTATTPPFALRSTVASQANVLWSFSIRPLEGSGTPADMIQRLITKYTVRMDHFSIKDQGSGDLSDGRKYAYLLYTSGGLLVEDQRYVRETILVLDEKRVLSIVEVSATNEWSSARRELQSITKSLKMVKTAAP